MLSVRKVCVLLKKKKLLIETEADTALFFILLECEDYQKMVSQTGFSLNNENATPTKPRIEFPFMVKLSDYSQGALISENFVLTIANNE